MDLGNIVQQLAGGLWAAVQLFVLTLVFSLPLGMVVCFGRRSEWAPFRRCGKVEAGQEAGRWVTALRRFRPVQLVFKFFISILRGTPLMLQLMVVYFGPYYLFGLNLSGYSRLLAAVIAFTINYAAYFAEIYRSGIQSIPVGQNEAAQVLGYSRSQTFLKIILPQMVKRVLPSVTNEVITLVKDTSLAFVIAYQELFTIAKQIAAAKTTVMPLFVAGIFYFIFNGVVAWIMERIERTLSYYN
ncbi:amino acid ABC transporter permease [Oscillibacter hominis]|uniref:Amino acid ABC transporter permease n=1 Tax=Oscillibacter hominis TaxID=2763056 RepID=A0A7G9B7Q7_9FIRM|nr:amino acid ABC transporter permease [Oscillibacter hominis]QNL45588.1 amino acid ABC transporter permease [Oscillibacter hominis]